ncbi:MAG TPA: hypothetical protein VL326_00600 [Kofleriaceae bacterium]|nr:hypothetical protein [Kofleriaceae bacterium]
MLFLLYAYPGFVTHEAADHLFYSRLDEFIDWQSPVLVELWRLSEWALGGPFGMLLVQSLLLLCGTFSITRKQVGDRAGAWIAVAMLLVPPLLATNAVIGVEAQLVAWLVAGLALLQSEKFSRRIGGLVMLVVVVGLRSGGAAIALPIIVSTFVWRTPFTGWRRYAVALGAWAVTVLVAAGLSYALIDERTNRDELRLALSDVGGIHGDESIAEQIYSPVFFKGAETPEERDALFATRRELIRDNPGAYLSFRLHVFAQALGVNKPKWWRPVFTDFVVTENDSVMLAHAGRHSLVQRALIFPVKAMHATPLFWPICYLALAIGLLGVAIWRRLGLEIALLSAGLLYELTLAFTSFRPNYPDSHPMIATTLLAAFLLLGRRLRQSRDR